LSAFGRIDGLAPYALVEGLRARAWRGERMTIAMVDIDPGAELPEHRHENEQLGIVLKGILRFTVDGETQDLGPGETWTIPSGVPHSAVAGPEGCTCIDVFAPTRADWEDLPRLEPSPPAWP